MPLDRTGFAKQGLHERRHLQTPKRAASPASRTTPRGWVGKAWHDPVWSKVISAGIIAMLGIGSAYFLRNYAPTFWATGVAVLWNLRLQILSVVIVAAAAFAWGRAIGKRIGIATGMRREKDRAASE